MEPTFDITDSYKGKLLLATPNMGDPRFRFAVIYIVSHDSKGAMGIIINKKKSNLHISDLLNQIGIEGDVQVADAPVLNGGPVDIDRGFVLHSADYFAPDTSMKISDTLSLTTTKDVLEALVSADEAPKRAMLAIGYAGWGAGQLENEIMDNAWLLLEGDEDLIFSDKLESKWTMALHDIGIDPSALSSNGGQA